MKLLWKYYWFIIPVAGWLVLRFLLDFNGLYGQDSYAYVLHAREWNSFFRGAGQPGPFFWPPNYSLVSGLVAFLFGSEIVAAQLVSVFSTIGIAWLLDKWLSKAYDVQVRSRIAFVSLAFLFSPYMFRLGMQSMSDTLGMFLLVAAFYQLWKFLRSNDLQSMLSWAVFSSLAITTRYPSVVVLLPVILYVGFRLLAAKQFGRLTAGIVVGSIPLLLAICWKLNAGGMSQVFGNDLIQDWSFIHFFQSQFSRSGGVFSYTVPNLLYNASLALHPGTLFFGIVLLPFSGVGLRSDVFRLLLLISVLGYLVFLSGIPFQNARVMTFTYPLVVMFFAPGFIKAELWSRALNVPVRPVFAMCLIVQWGLCVRAMQPSVNANHFEREMAQWIAVEFPQRLVYTDAYSQLFEVYRTGHSVGQIYGAPVQTFAEGSLFIFNPSLADFKLQGTMTLQNWQFANEHMQVKEEKCWPNGWCVYSLMAK